MNKLPFTAAIVTDGGVEDGRIPSTGNVLEGMEFILVSGVEVIGVEESSGEDRGAVVSGVAAIEGVLDITHAWTETIRTSKSKQEYILEDLADILQS